MCTILKYKSCVGRNFDYEISYKEELRHIRAKDFDLRYDIIGMCTGLVKDYPLLYDGMNQHGLCCGGLAFTGNAEYFDKVIGMNSIPAYDFTLRVLGNCKSVEEVKQAMDVTIITNENYSDDLQNTDLHWFVADKKEAIVIESTKDGLHWYDAETNVLTNNPPYEEQLDMYKFSSSMIGDVAPSLTDDMEWWSRGRETDGLAGGYASDERFERVSFLKEKLENADNIFDDVNQTFHLLAAAEQVYGVTEVDDKFEYTIYSIVYNMNDKMVYLQNYDGNRNRYMY